MMGMIDGNEGLYDNLQCPWNAMEYQSQKHEFAAKETQRVKDAWGILHP